MHAFKNHNRMINTCELTTVNASANEETIASFMRLYDFIILNTRTSHYMPLIKQQWRVI